MLALSDLVVEKREAKVGARACGADDGPGVGLHRTRGRIKPGQLDHDGDKNGPAYA
jgi:hypothetical protein